MLIVLAVNLGQQRVTPIPLEVEAVGEHGILDRIA